MTAKPIAILALTSLVIVGLAAAGFAALRCYPVWKVEAKVRDQLKDPDSAVFSRVRAFQSGAGCGLVNAKNSMGGYVGATQFVLDSSGRAHYFTAQRENPESIEGKIKFLTAELDWARLVEANCK